MVKNILLVLFVGFISLTNISWKSRGIDPVKPHLKEFSNYSQDLYNKLNSTNLNFEVFKYALKGYIKLKSNNKLNNSEYLTIIDMSLSSNSDRFFIIDMKNNKIDHQSVVAHGANTGLEFAKNFSNTMSSHKTSLGFYRTAETYFGKHGLSLRLDGLEFSNNNARKRAIVIHSAKYVSDKFILNNGRLGRSWGCPAIPDKDYKEIIQKIKKGSILFIYAPNKNYLNKSSLASSDVNIFFNNQITADH